MNTQDNGVRQIESHDGVLCLLMRRSRGRWHLLRTELQPCGSRIEMAMVFPTPFELDRFFEADAMRFSYPLLFQKARNEFDALLAGLSTEPKAGSAVEPHLAMPAVFDVIRRIPSVEDQGAMVELLHDAKQALGAESAFFVSYARDNSSTESVRLLLACDPLWCLAYQQERRLANDPWAIYLRGNTRPICASEFDCRASSRIDAQAAAARFGMVSAFVVPAPAFGGLPRLGALVLGSSRAGHFESTLSAGFRALAQGLAMELHRCWVSQLRVDTLRRHRLTKEELVLLQLERGGLCTKEIARHLDTTCHSVNSRFQRLIKKLGVPNRKVAARLATEFDLIG